MSELERLTILKNIAANGRTFCVLLCAICIAVYLDKRDAFHIALAITAAWPIGMSYIAETIYAVGSKSKSIPLIVFAGNALCVLVVVVSLWLT